MQAKSLNQAFQTFPTQNGLPIGIFGAAFITKYRDGMPLTEADCNNNGHIVPELSIKDMVIAHEIFTGKTCLV